MECLAHYLVSLVPGRNLTEIRFYTGVYRESVNAPMHHFWMNKLNYLQRQGVYVYRGRVSSSRRRKAWTSAFLLTW